MEKIKIKIKIAIASDHAAFEEKAAVISYLENQNFSVFDFGTNSSKSCHYPKFVFPLVNSLYKEECLFGILLCGTGIGVSMVANRFQNMRAGLCRSVEEAKLTRQHNNANILCMGAKISSLKEMQEMSIAFLSESFEGQRHQLRLDLFDSLGEQYVPKE